VDTAAVWQTGTSGLVGGDRKLLIWKEIGFAESGERKWFTRFTRKNGARVWDRDLRPAVVRVALTLFESFLYVDHLPIDLRGLTHHPEQPLPSAALVPICKSTTLTTPSWFTSFAAAAHPSAWPRTFRRSETAKVLS